MRTNLVLGIVALPSLLGCASGDDRLDLATVEQLATVCAEGPTLQGIDVSKYQGNVDWAAAKVDGVDFGFARVSDGVNTLDSYFDDNWGEMRAAGIIRGAYQYFRPSQSVATQAQIMLDAIGTLEADDLAPVIDVEADGGLSPAVVAGKVDEWIDLVQAATGRRPTIYTGRFFWTDEVGGADFRPSPLWIAHYTSAECPNIPAPWTEWAFWQFTDSGDVAGVAGNVDVNVFNGDLAALYALTGGGGGECGDGACGGDETTESCAVDCPPCGVIAAAGSVIDDADACFEAGGPAQYIREVSDAGHGDTLKWTHTTDGASAANYGLWELYLAEAGTYLVEVFTDGAYAESIQASYFVEHAGTEVEVTIDQTAVDGWQSLGELTFAAGGAQRLRLGDNTGEPGSTDTQLVFDAVRLTRTDAPIDPPDDEDDDDEDETDPDSASAGCAAGGSGSSSAALLLVLGLMATQGRRRRRV